MPSLQAITILREMQRRHPGRFPDSQLRTLQRHMRRWSALAGPDRDVIFRQGHPPGAQGLSDFTDAGELGVTMAGLAFPHRFYHFALAHSQQEYARVVEGGESFSALAEGLQNALWLIAARRASIAPTASRRRSRTSPSRMTSRAAKDFSHRRPHPPPLKADPAVRTLCRHRRPWLIARPIGIGRSTRVNPVKRGRPSGVPGFQEVSTRKSGWPNFPAPPQKATWPPPPPETRLEGQDGLAVLRRHRSLSSSPVPAGP
jgi:hypothetical protein